jgi:hypothetical protein
LDGTPTIADYTQTLQLTAGVPDAGEFISLRRTTHDKHDKHDKPGKERSEARSA